MVQQSSMQIALSDDPRSSLSTHISVLPPLASMGTWTQVCIHVKQARKEKEERKHMLPRLPEVPGLQGQGA